jgi:hypothetical protein
LTRSRATQVLHSIVYVRREPRLKARVVKSLKQGDLVDVDGLQGSWGRTVIPGTYDSEGQDGWVLTRHSHHGHLLALHEDASILLPHDTASDALGRLGL